MTLGFVRNHGLMPSPGRRVCQSDSVSSAACNTAEDLIRAAHPEIDESQPDAEASQGKLRATAVPPATSSRPQPSVFLTTPLIFISASCLRNRRHPSFSSPPPVCILLLHPSSLFHP